MVTVMKAKCSHRKGCKLFTMYISSDKGKEVEDSDVLSRYPIFPQFKDLFPEDITEFPPHREVEFSIDLLWDLQHLENLIE